MKSGFMMCLPNAGFPKTAHRQPHARNQFPVAFGIGVAEHRTCPSLLPSHVPQRHGAVKKSPANQALQGSLRAGHVKTPATAGSMLLRVGKASIPRVPIENTPHRATLKMGLNGGGRDLTNHCSERLIVLDGTKEEQTLFDVGSVK